MTGAVLRLLFGVVAVSLTSACTSSPPRVSPAQQGLSANQIADRSGSPAISPPEAASNGAATAPSQTTDTAASQAEVDKAMRKRGYKPALDHGRRVYCREMTPTGSHFSSDVCLTAAQIEDRERAAKDVLNGNHQQCIQTKAGCN